MKLWTLFLLVSIFMAAIGIEGFLLNFTVGIIELAITVVFAAMTAILFFFGREMRV